MPFKKLAEPLLNSLADAVAERVLARLDSRPEHREPALTETPVGDGLQHISLDYPVAPKPRWGSAWDLPDHPELLQVIRADDASVREYLALIARYTAELRAIPGEAVDASGPYWINGWLPGWDGAAIYAGLAARNPSTYLEIGSGNSTRFAHRAISDHSLRTKILSVDPCPRAEINELCDEILRTPFEDVDLALLERLQSGDVVFVDNSHRAFQNSDVTVAILELLPRLPHGVLVGFHDIFLPNDYPSAWADRYYSEQYLLAAFLLGGHRGTRIVLPAFDASTRPEMRDAVNTIWDVPGLEAVERHGGAFWLETC